MHFDFRPAVPADAKECVRIRGLTRENSVSEQRLASLGITSESWAEDIRSGELPGYIGTAGGEMAGYCFGSSSTGEIIVLAIQPRYENLGLGKLLLGMTVKHLRQIGHTRLFLGCASDPTVRSHGFYRHLGWRSTGRTDRYGDEVLELVGS